MSNLRYFALHQRDGEFQFGTHGAPIGSERALFAGSRAQLYRIAIVTRRAAFVRGSVQGLLHGDQIRGSRLFVVFSIFWPRRCARFAIARLICAARRSAWAFASRARAEPA